MKKNLRFRFQSLWLVLLVTIPTALISQGNSATIHNTKSDTSGPVTRRSNDRKHCISDYGFTQEQLESDSSFDAFGKRVLADQFTGIDTSNLKLQHVIRNKDLWVPFYEQTAKGIPIEESDIGFAVSKSGELFAFRATTFPNANCLTSPSVDVKAGLVIAKRDFGRKKIEVRGEPELRILPEKQDRKYIYHLAWKIVIFTTEIPPQTFQYFVSTENGDILRKANLMRE